MKRKIILPVQANKALVKLGENIKEARIKRRISTVLLAEKTGFSRVTLAKIEKGNPYVSIGAYAEIIFILGMTDKLYNLLDPSSDREGNILEKARYPKRIRYKKNEGQLF
ncbi:MAG: helix-turn-helix transcriptional regulator [Endomicrobiaceae bacterium]